MTSFHTCGLCVQWCLAYNNCAELSLLLSQYDPTAVCIQETLLHSNKTASFKNYSYYGIPAVENNGSLHGGVALLVKNTTPHQQLHINTGLQAIALRATCHKTITINQSINQSKHISIAPFVASESEAHDDGN